MTIIIGIIFGVLYIIQPIDSLRAPVEWMNTTLITYANSFTSWALGPWNESDSVKLIGLILTVGAPGVAGLLLNLIAPLGRIARLVFSIVILLVSFGAFGTLEWQHALLFSMATGLIGLVLTLLSGPIMEAAAGFFSVTLGAVQVRAVVTDTPSAPMQELMNLVASMLHISVGESYWVCLVLAFVPLLLVAAWIIYRLAPSR